MKICTLALMIFFGLSLCVYSDQMISKIELNDGSVIEGEISSLDNGVYSVNTESLGKVEIDASKIRNIATKNTGASLSIPAQAKTQIAASNEEFGPKMQRMQAKIAQDPEAMKTMAGMLSDPQFQEILNDPDIVNAVKTQDVNTLMQNDKFMGLIDNQNFLELQDKLKKQEGQGS